MTRASLAPGFGPAFERAKSGQPGLVEVLEQHNPLFVAKLAGEMRWHVSPQGFFQTVVEGISVAGLDYAMTTSGSGWQREKALRAIKTVHEPFTLALLLLRLNDWVLPVSRAAIETLGLLIRTQPDQLARAIPACIPLIIDEDRYGRRAGDTQATRLKLLEVSDVSRRLKDSVLNDAGDDAANTLGFLLRAPVLDDHLDLMALQARHPRVRAMALRAALSGAHHWKGQGFGRRLFTRPINADINTVQLAQLALSDHVPAIKNIALQHLVERSDEPLSDSLLRSFALDHGRGLSDTAIFALKKQGFDVRGWLLSLLDTDMRPRAASVLGRHGHQEDGSVLFDLWQRDADDKCLVAAAQCGEPRAVTALKLIALTEKDVARARRATKVLFRRILLKNTC
ncbi:hypothetical protein [Pseudaestuariivita rosea]|uniref:hypothetical protein n=1 Tax=Pseudaestuariivita rosea TaxID=2763263 RepID=UPI001ABA47E1|nr:hypothetical protein [Pseudaestuariivita rosea]